MFGFRQYLHFSRAFFPPRLVICHFSLIRESCIFPGGVIYVSTHCVNFLGFLLYFFSHDRFKSSTVKECIHAILKEKLANVQYIPEEMPELTKSLSETIKDRLKGKEVCWRSNFFSCHVLSLLTRSLFLLLFLKLIPSPLTDSSLLL